ncbi:MAG: endonuclease [Chloroflexi bacterium]|nr:MAG: endonuclease [Chloroflexota bacterium]
MTHRQTVFLTFILLFLSISAACQQIENYEAANEPLFAANYAESPPPVANSIRVVTWNIKFAEQIEAAGENLRSVESLQQADVLLLQEMDETGVDTLARTLHLNYVYYPASVHSHHGKNFGNAILSAWPISAPGKILLPHKNPKNGQRRTATRAVVTINGIDVLVYSVHTETFWLDRRKRLGQFEALAQDISPDAPAVIVGGDFNTATQRSISDLDKIFAQARLNRVSEGAGYTVQSNGLEFALDHVYARGFVPLQTGVYRNTSASDHFPVWVVLNFSPEK